MKPSDQNVMSSNPRLHRTALSAVVYSALAIFFAYAYYIRYWAWRDCIQEAQSSCVTPAGDNLTGGGQFWIVPALLFAVAALQRVLRYLRR